MGTGRARAVGAGAGGLVLAFTSVAIATGFERRYGVLERLAATPLGRSGLLAGKAGAVLLILAGQLAVLAAVALALGWRPAFTGSRHWPRSPW